MSKALEILKKRKRTLLLIKASSVLTEKESIEINGEIKEFDEAIAELEAQEVKSCESCANYSNYNSHKAWECTKAHKFVMCGHAFEPPKNFCCNMHESKA